MDSSSVMAGRMPVSCPRLLPIMMRTSKCRFHSEKNNSELAKDPHWRLKDSSLGFCWCFCWCIEAYLPAWLSCRYHRNDSFLVRSSN